jgi:uncharacterized membrane protein YgcG
MAKDILESSGNGNGRAVVIARPRLRRPSSLWLWILGMACVGGAAVLFPGGLMTYLTPFFDKGPAQHAFSPPLLVRALGILVFLVHCVSVLYLGIAGAVILHRAWHPGVVWQGHESDPPWWHKVVRFYNRLSLNAPLVALRGTLLAFLLSIFGRLYIHYGELLRIPFSMEPDAVVAHYIYPLVLYIWPLSFLAVLNIYAVKRHFLPEDIHLEGLVRPADIVDLMHKDDLPWEKKAVTKTEDDRTTFREWASAAIAAVIHFIQIRTVVLRHRTVEIGHTDVNSRWWSQQGLRGYRWGKDHRFSESNGWSLAIHAAVIFGPIILAAVTNLFGCIDPYKIPFGGGGPKGGPKQRQKKAVKVVKKKKKYLVSPYSSIVFAEITPDMMDLKLEEETEHHWTGRATGEGTSRGGGQGPAGGFGYGGGVPGGCVRFIRLQHNGGDWDRNMDLSGDFQLLREFFKRTNIPIARKTEFVTIDQLSRFPKKQSPPFVYITGRQWFEISAKEAYILKEYLLKRGGFILGDSPGENFGRCFRAMISRVLGSQARWVDIPDDDEIYTCYFMLPTGAPPLWHHDGYRGLGIKIQGRWVVYYHPGDMGDAWKIGHSGAGPEAVENAYRMGTNLIHYSFTHYIDFHKGQF